ncbi:hypothetical protein [Hydrogenimonas sp.]
MKKIVYAVLLATRLLAASMDDIDIRIWKRIIFDLSLKEYKIYTLDTKLKEMLEKIPGITLVEDCTRATLIVETKESVVTDRRCSYIPRLSNDYRLLVKNPNEIGAFFWMKGRPTIILSRPRLKRFGLEVDEELQDYLEDIQ